MVLPRLETVEIYVTKLSTTPTEQECQAYRTRRTAATRVVRYGRPPADARRSCSADGTQSLLATSLQRHALLLDLRDPRLDTVLRHLGLVVLVAGKADELATRDGLGLGEVVAIGGGSADDAGSLLLEARCELVHGVVEVVTVTGLVADAEHSDLLALQVDAGEVIVKELVPRGARALRVGAGVSGRRADDQAIVAVQVATRDVSDVDGIDAGDVRKVAGDGLSVASGGGIDEPDGHRGRGRARHHGIGAGKTGREAGSQAGRGGEDRLVKHRCQ